MRAVASLTIGQHLLNLAVSEIAQGMQRKTNLGEEAELTRMSMSIPSQDLTPRCAL